MYAVYEVYEVYDASVNACEDDAHLAGARRMQ